MTLDVDGYTLFLAAAAGSTAALFALRALGGSDDARLVRQMARTPRLDIAAVEELRAGEVVRVVGTARSLDGDGDRTLAASLIDGAAALALDVELGVAIGDSHTPLGRALRMCSFLVDDGSGALLVRAATARLLLQSNTIERVLPRGALSDAQCALVDAAQARSPHRAAGAIAWRETRLLPGARVALVGRVARVAADPSEGHAYRDRSARAALVDAPSAPLLVSDDPAALA